MNPEPPRAVEPTAGDGSLLVVLALLALVVGAVSGLVGALFLLALTQANHWRDELIGWAHGQRFIGFALVVGGCALLTALAAWLARDFPRTLREAASETSRRLCTGQTQCLQRRRPPSGLQWTPKGNGQLLGWPSVVV